jgi:plastocyanin
VLVPDHRRGTLRRTAGVLVVAAALALLTACAGSSSTGTTASSSAAGTSAGGSSSSGQTVTATEADFSITLDRSDLAAGTYEITIVNNGHATHDLVVERDGGQVAASDTVAPGASTTLTVDLTPGDYVFFCSIGNHRAMGMETDVHVS